MSKGPVDPAQAERRWCRVLLLATTGILLVAALVQISAAGIAQVSTALVFCALVSVGELGHMTVPGGREAAPVAFAAALGYAFLCQVGAEPAVHSALQVVGVTAVGMGLGSLPHLAVGRQPPLEPRARRLVTIALAALAFRPLAELDFTRTWWVAIIAMTGCAFLACVADAVTATSLLAERTRKQFGVALADEVRATGVLSVACAATGTMTAVAVSASGPIALFAFIAPILAAQLAYRRLVWMASTTSRNVAAIARISEIGGYVNTGHGRRVARLSVAVGTDLGMPERQLLRLEYAALLHDLGQCSLRDPLPAGATMLTSPEEREHIAELGSDTILRIGHLDEIAHIVRHQHAPYRRFTPKDANPTSLSSHILKVANAYDELMGGVIGKPDHQSVIQTLRKGSGVDYDPVVVRSLVRVTGSVQFSV